jgi:hypothetical protein
VRFTHREPLLLYHTVPLWTGAATRKDAGAAAPEHHEHIDNHGGGGGDLFAWGGGERRGYRPARVRVQAVTGSSRPDDAVTPLYTPASYLPGSVGVTSVGPHGSTLFHSRPRRDPSLVAWRRLGRGEIRSPGCRPHSFQHGVLDHLARQSSDRSPAHRHVSLANHRRRGAVVNVQGIVGEVRNV